jgi:hypothetical protein
MFHITRPVFVAITCVAGCVVALATVSAIASMSRAELSSTWDLGASGSTVTLHDGADVRWVDTIGWALARFDDAGLGAPRTEIHVWDQAQPQCLDRAGAFTVRGDETRVDLCSTYNPGDIATGIRRRVTLHELAHAWEHLNVDDTTRTTFMTHRGITTWNDDQTDHNSRGVEKAAYAISYALDLTPRPNNDNTCGYTILTGKHIPSLHTDSCPT